MILKANDIGKEIIYKGKKHKIKHVIPCTEQARLVPEEHYDKFHWNYSKLFNFGFLINAEIKDLTS